LREEEFRQRNAKKHGRKSGASMDQKRFYKCSIKKSAFELELLIEQKEGNFCGSSVVKRVGCFSNLLKLSISKIESTAVGTDRYAERHEPIGY
jgi:hypothetical protein